MKKIMITGILLLLAASSFACDICGCSVSNYNPFLFPQLSKKFIGVSYMHRSYTLHPGPESSRQESHSLLLTGQYSLGKKWQLVGLVPYQWNTLHSKSTKNIRSGLGDATLLLNYKAWEKLTKIWRQTFTAGVGIKLPTGSYITPQQETIEEQNFQSGTGSTDYLLNGSYLLSYRKLAFAGAASYKYNTQNKEGYRFGDVFTSSARVLYRKELTSLSIAPYVQCTNEWQLQDAAKNKLIQASGGNVLYGGGGVDVNTKKVATGINVQTPITQTLGGGSIHVQPRITAHLSYSF